ncbi:predicted protein [Aspergillus terreus NIH2624]|uniref:Uncharacterized protein n=1 Tax=Aspergillus terreus (strain NIH 2624 / FGSC A1156) TaxID=341663 RepID=Q0CTW3_ASPTN|nr:uncharacterized protein ATEG_02871 [Aspergillus terreus NIH2624]EAU36145.1 predicted protein [Aspergillus terreus NIH2624]
MASTQKCRGYEPDPTIHTDEYDKEGKPEEAQKVINTAHILHFTFHDVPDEGGFPTVLNLIGGIMPAPDGSDVLYAHGYVPEKVLQRFGEALGISLKVTVTASKVYSYYCGYTPFSHGITFRSAVINGHASLLRYDPGTTQCQESISDGDISKNEKLEALSGIVDGIFGGDGRWKDTRRPFKDEELKRVPVLRVDIDKKASRLHERLGVLGYEAEWEKGTGKDYWEGAIPIWETYGDVIKGNTTRNPPDYLKVFERRKKHNEDVAVKEAKKPYPRLAQG